MFTVLEVWDIELGVRATVLRVWLEVLGEDEDDIEEGTDPDKEVGVWKAASNNSWATDLELSLSLRWVVWRLLLLDTTGRGVELHTEVDVSKS